MKKIRIACRESVLAVAQAHMVVQAIRDYDPLIIPELVICKTPADKLSHLPRLPASLEKAHLPVLEEQLRTKQADLVVHNLQDLPFEENPDYPLVAVGRRMEPGYALVVSSKRNKPDHTRPIGISSKRHKIQLAKLYPGWESSIVNGDLTACLSVLESGVYGGLILPAASLTVTHHQEQIFQILPLHQMTPACCQGIIAVQGRAGEWVNYLAGFHNVDAWDMALAERAFGKAIGGDGADSPMAAVAAIKDDSLTIQGLLIDRKGTVWEGILSGRREDAVQIGAALATRLKLNAAGPQPAKEYND